MLMIEIDVGSGCFAINGFVTLDSSLPLDILSSFLISIERVAFGRL